MDVAVLTNRTNVTSPASHGFASSVFLLTVISAFAGTAPVAAQSPQDTVLRGLSTVTVLSKTAEGRAALSANLVVTSGIQTGAIPQPTLLPDAEQRGQSFA